MGGKAAVPWYLAGGVPSANCLIAYQPIGATSLANSYINIANPGVLDATTTAAPAFATATGWTIDGATKFINAPVSNFNPVAGTAIIRVNVTGDGGSSAGNAFNVSDGTNVFTIVPSQGGTVVRCYNGTTVKDNAPALSGDGVLAIAGNKFYRNGELDGTALTVPASYSVSNLIIGNRAAALRELAGSIYAFALYDIVLTPLQVAAVASRMASLP